VTLAVLVDRGGRELPIEPAFAAATIELPTAQLASARARRRALQFSGLRGAAEMLSRATRSSTRTAS
jgi:hypothetical protein